MERSELARDHVRRAYERARFGGALLAAWPVPILLGVAAILHEHLGAGALICSAALAVAALVGLMACGAVGLGGAAGVVVGLAAGGIPALALSRRAA